jgi:hypothetical protein
MQHGASIWIGTRDLFIQFHANAWRGWRDDMTVLETDRRFQYFAMEPAPCFNALKDQEVG